MKTLEFQIKDFEGPLDLLLVLVTKNKVDIYDIPITLILDQYMEYLERMRQMDMEIAGEFITMASELMLIKSRMLLPKREEDEEEDPRAALAASLTEYKLAKEAAAALAERFLLYSGRFAKETSDIAPDEKPAPRPANDLYLALKKLFNRSGEKIEAEGEANRMIGSLIGTKPASVPERVVVIMHFLYRRKSASFDEILNTATTRSELISSFVALLELIRVNRVTIGYKDGAKDGEYTITLNKEESYAN